MPLEANVTVDSTTWAALALVLTVLGGAFTWVAFRKRGLAAGLRGAAWTLVPVAAWLTGTLKLFANMLNDVIDWAARLVFSPTVWLGIIVAGLAVTLWIVSGVLRTRGIGVRDQAREVPAGRAKQVSGTAPDGPGKPARAGKRKPANDDLEDMDDIEAILKKHGI